jgi:dTDP-4-dehydrorhamnose 3,5-epimerase-like enzyme
VDGSGCAEEGFLFTMQCAKKINAPLALNCGRHEKAFSSSMFGTVLGTHFDIKEMEWSLPVAKEGRIQKVIYNFCL